MQAYENARRAVSYSPIARAEWLQVRAIVGAANLHRMSSRTQQVRLRLFILCAQP
jgi:hypothetical protein